MAHPLLDLLRVLQSRGYDFVTPTPASHGHVIARPDYQEACDLRGFFGWSLPLAAARLDTEVKTLLEEAGMLRLANGMAKSLVRVSTLHGRLYLHSSYPTETDDSVFFGPDSYRFADLVRAELSGRELGDGHLVVDMGTGAGVGAIVAAAACPQARVIGTDINPVALWMARVNAAAAGVAITTMEAGDLRQVGGQIDVVTANPPYIIDRAGRAYRDGGGMKGAQTSLDMAEMALPRLAPGGRLILYTGSAIVQGHDQLRSALTALVAGADCSMRYWEIDPDVFGEELANPQYADVERIALVAAVIERASH